MYKTCKVIQASNFITRRYLNIGFHNVNGASQIQIQSVTYYIGGRFPAHGVTSSGSRTNPAPPQKAGKDRYGLGCPGSLDPTFLAHWPFLGPFGLLCPQGSLCPGNTWKKIMGKKEKVNYLLLNSYSVPVTALRNVQTVLINPQTLVRFYHPRFMCKENEDYIG